MNQDSNSNNNKTGKKKSNNTRLSAPNLPDERNRFLSTNRNEVTLGCCNDNMDRFGRGNTPVSFNGEHVYDQNRIARMSQSTPGNLSVGNSRCGSMNVNTVSSLTIFSTFQLQQGLGRGKLSSRSGEETLLDIIEEALRVIEE